VAAELGTGTYVDLMARWTATGFVDTTSGGTMVYEERTGSGTGP
jgi:hypothetical protein